MHEFFCAASYSVKKVDWLWNPLNFFFCCTNSLEQLQNSLIKLVTPNTTSNNKKNCCEASCLDGWSINCRWWASPIRSPTGWRWLDGNRQKGWRVAWPAISLQGGHGTAHIGLSWRLMTLQVNECVSCEITPHSPFSLIEMVCTRCTGHPDVRSIALATASLFA